MSKPDYHSVAAKFRSYASLCREWADRTADPGERKSFIARAQRWDRDAVRVMQDAEIAAESIVLLRRLERQ